MSQGVNITEEYGEVSSSRRLTTNTRKIRAQCESLMPGGIARPLAINCTHGEELLQGLSAQFVSRLHQFEKSFRPCGITVFFRATDRLDQRRTTKSLSGNASGILCFDGALAVIP